MSLLILIYGTPSSSIKSLIFKTLSPLELKVTFKVIWDPPFLPWYSERKAASTACRRPPWDSCVDTHHARWRHLHGATTNSSAQIQTFSAYLSHVGYMIVYRGTFHNDYNCFKQSDKFFKNTVYKQSLSITSPVWELDVVDVRHPVDGLTFKTPESPLLHPKQLVRGTPKWNSGHKGGSCWCSALSGGDQTGSCTGLSFNNVGRLCGQTEVWSLRCRTGTEPYVQAREAWASGAGGPVGGNLPPESAEPASQRRSGCVLPKWAPRTLPKSSPHQQRSTLLPSIRTRPTLWGATL